MNSRRIVIKYRVPQYLQHGYRMYCQDSVESFGNSMLGWQNEMGRIIMFSHNYGSRKFAVVDGALASAGWYR
jgi:hypothetical protein